jgi:malate dehydrogenase (quinone)
MNEELWNESPDVVLIGAGIMSATLGMLLKQLEPGLTIEMFESLDSMAEESSNAWNNAGTGHAALCELNYTPEAADGSVDPSKAIAINESFEVSKQFWAHLVQDGMLEDPSGFITQVPHMSFVRGEANVEYLRKRHAALTASHLFREMSFSEDPAELKEWMPLMMEGRDPSEKVAATRMDVGTDVNFGALTKELIGALRKQLGFHLHLGQRVTDLSREPDGRWRITVAGRGGRRTISARFVFLGAGGGALPLLQKSGIPEGRGFGGFPVSGQWLRCDNPELVERHHAKVYGKASVGAPPMSVPHLDTRIIDGKRSLLFGPYAGFSTKFLKGGSYLDLPLSVKPDNIVPMLCAGRDNIDLTRYLIGQVLQSPKDRFAALQEFIPDARMEDWRLEIAGQRVQIIKKSLTKGGVLQFGTEVVAAADGSISALLGASPGASTAVSIMLDLVRKCFPERMQTEVWQERMQQMIPSFGASLAGNEGLWGRVQSWTHEVLCLRDKDPDGLLESFKN